MTVGDADQEPQLSLALLVTRVLGIAALVIAASAALFFGLGRLDDATLVVADGPDEQIVGEDDVIDEDPDLEADDGQNDEAGTEPEPTDPDGAAEDDVDAAEPENGSDEASDAEPDGDPDGEEPEPDEPDEPEEPEEPEDDRIDPSTISVQVLDGYQADGGTAAGAVATELQDAGYRIIARNPALLYDVTTVLWTAGHQAAGEQVARDIGAGEVREQPGTLSTSVMVHIVVGADRG